MEYPIKSSTRPCTVIFFNDHDEYHDLSLTCRLLTQNIHMDIKPFKARIGMTKEEVLNILTDL